MTPDTGERPRRTLHGYGNARGWRRVARKTHHCQWGDCRTIQPGEVYVTTVQFPGSDDTGYATHAKRPVRMALCAKCALHFGYDLDDIPYDQLCAQGLL